MTLSERKLWKLLRPEKDAHYRKQIAVDGYVFDFGDYSARILIELDGSIHRLNNVELRDKEKEAYAKRHGFKLPRFTNDDVWTRPDWVLDQVRALRDAPHPLPPPRKGEGE
ncbi:MAG: DUF559 domain-containing protein [Hyphomonadaceae bacterium]|nr:DUF559 domain-containing protein [Hyphomonadaceae bacterium]